ncbi:NAD(P)H-hydrate dehydratase [Deinococcus navajonensis]|uniref:Bifunctional NAD(P)H-hydrate repair enzyme n=1 Tax=Deinococcus navajonensis TaxID=309884 RepID=A0ABV8XL13_9DEIO
MTELVLGPREAGAVDARLAQAALLDLAMEEAGAAVAAAARNYPDGPVLLLAGGGANGGDALVAARHLHVQGREVTVLAAPPTHELARLNRRRLRAVGVSIRFLTPEAVQRFARGAALLVDGLLGTGFRPPLRPPLATLIEAVNAAGCPVLSIDLPSGLDALSAEAPLPAVQADSTVTLMGWKPALLFGTAAARAGRVTLAPLTVPPGWVHEAALAGRPADAEVGALLPRRQPDAHKGTAGHVWVLGGHPGTTGAPAMTGVGALRAGAGLVSVHSLADIPLVMPELMIRRHRSWASAFSTMESQRPDAVVVGMGLGPQAAEVARRVLSWEVPTVLDADALQPELAGLGHASCLWTPHPGEAARLLNTSTAELTRHPLDAARALQQRLGGVVVFKGGPSVVAHEGGLSVARGGHPGMASAGMGDTLSGVLGALLGQGLLPWAAAVAGVRLHARAGERAAATHGYGLSASDVAQELGGAWRDLRGPS